MQGESERDPGGLAGSDPGNMILKLPNFQAEKFQNFTPIMFHKKHRLKNFFLGKIF